MRRSVVLVSLDWIRPQDPRTGLGVASIASALRHAGVHVQVVGDAVNRPGFDEDAFTNRVIALIEELGHDVVVGIAAFVWNEPEVVRLLGRVRAYSSATIVLGGPQVSYVGPGGLEALYPEVDLFVRGHGEAAMVAIALSGHQRGLGIHVAGTADAGERADLDLGDLPSPHLDGTLPIGPQVRWETQRGCPFACKFCQHREPGNRLRNRNLAEERVLAEAAAFATGGVVRASVLDPIFHTDRTRAVRLLRQFKEIGLRAELSLQCRFELVDDAFLDALDGLNVALEFGLQTIHLEEGRAIGRPNNMERVEGVIRQLHGRDLDFEVSLIYGLPNQTLESFSRSVDWCLERNVPRVRAWPLMLLRGTPLHTDRARWGFAESIGERIPIVVSSRTFTADEHAQMAQIAEALLGPTAPTRLVAGVR